MPSLTTVDSRGRACPLPVIDLARAIPTIEVGGAIELLADDPGAAADIPAWCRMRGQDLAAVEDRGDHQAYTITRTV